MTLRNEIAQTGIVMNGVKYAECGGDLADHVIITIQSFAARGSVEAREVADLLFGAGNVREGVYSTNEDTGYFDVFPVDAWPDGIARAANALVIVLPTPTGDAP